MMRILIRECRRMGRRRIGQARIGTDEGEEMALPDLDLQEAVERLEEALRMLVKLHYFADLPLNHLSELIDVPEGTLKSRLHRARKQLAGWLEGSEERGMGYGLR